MDEEICKAAMSDIANEPEQKSDNEESSPDLRKKQILRKYYAWWFGLFISFIPLLAIPFAKIISDDTSVDAFGKMLFGNYEIVFIGVSVMITSLNDFISSPAKDKKSWIIGFSLFLISLGSLTYAVIALCQTFQEKINESVILGFNIAFLVVAIILASVEIYAQWKEMT